ncbi:thioredoxin domain-containing protein [Demequina sp. NBRC 110056]|uniref:DsbA family protein n=1 Tax=Demequina sp. NBRC 110056 TaxID=1570345 RepID=UPI0009FF48C8|nr:thioredoxin domain-containing protein [Demequina sp. NBRC 110056]
MAKNNGSPKNAKAAAARAQAQKNVKTQERRTTLGIIIGVGIAVLIFGGIVFFIVQSSSVPGLDSEDVVAPAGADTTGGIPVGSGGVVGEDIPADVPRVDLYEDFMCPVCGQFEDINAEDIDAMREAGTIAVYYHPISILDRFSSGTQYSTRAANAAATVADAAPEAYLDFTHAMYANQPEEGGTGLSDEQIEQIAITAGVPEDVAATLDDGIFTKWVVAATDQGSVDGVGGTPTVMVDRTILEQAEVPYFSEGALRTYLEGL